MDISFANRRYVIYEHTMLGTIVATIAAFLTTTGLPRHRNRIYDPEVPHRKMLVGLEGPELLCDGTDEIGVIDFRDQNVPIRLFKFIYCV